MAEMKVLTELRGWCMHIMQHVDVASYLMRVML